MHVGFIRECDECPPPCGATRRRLSEARRLYRRFHAFAGERVIRARCVRRPRVLVHLGWLRGLIYRSDRGQAGRPRSFIHMLETPARLACDPCGRQLYILGGNYRVTRRGIEG